MKRWLLCALLIVAASAGAWSQQAAVEVKVGARPVFIINAAFGAITPEERAEIVHRRIERILHDPALDPDHIAVTVLADGTTAVTLDRFPVVAVSDADAQAEGLTRQELAEKWALALRSAIAQLKPLVTRERKSPPVKFLSEHRVLLLVLQVAILLLLAHGLGEVMRKLGQPPVIGQILAGIVLGHSFLGWLWPDVQALVFPRSETQSYLLEVVSWLGVLFLLMLTGLETDVELIRRQLRPAAWATVLGMLLPLGMGVALGLATPARWLTAEEHRTVFALFVGTALLVSSVPVVAKILQDMGLLRRSIGQVILAVAIISDTVGWLLVAVVASLAEGEVDAAAILRVALGTTAYLAFIFTLGRKWMFGLLRWVHDRVGGEDALLGLVVVLVLLSAAVTQAVGVHAVLGAFVVGVVLRQSAVVSELIVHRLEGVTMAVFAPVFFATAGIHIDLRVLAEGPLLGLTLLFTATACVSKILGCYVGGRMGGMDRWTALSLGIGTNARGAMGLILAVLGFSLGILTVSVFSVLVIMAVVTTVMTPPLLTWSLGRVPSTAEEEARLSQERLRAGSFFSRVRRVLLPTHGGPGAMEATRILRSVGSAHPLDVTAHYVGSDTAAAQEALAALLPSLQATGIEASPRIVASAGAVDGILEEAARGYHMVVLGAGHALGEGTFGETVDGVVAASPCPVLVVREGRASEPAGGCVLLPSTAAVHARRAAELAVLVARQRGLRLRLLHVIETPPESLVWTAEHRQLAEEAARDHVEELSLLAQAFGLEVEARVIESGVVPLAIAEAASEDDVSLCVLGAARRSAARLFLGPTIPYVLERAPCPIAVLIA